MNAWFAVAAVLSAATCLVHLLAGGREIARPLLDAQGLRTVPRLTSYYCWHLVTIALAGLCLAFAAAATGASRDLALAATLFAALSAALNLGLILRFRLPFWHFPQWALFVPIAASGLAGLAA